jgi:tRNA 5-methylaminomethyl-2-thiouridine biosynthesis bifunctional protein
VPDITPFTQTFGDYRKSKNWRIDALGAYHPNLYINVGHGSRGLTYTPLAAEVLACIITGEVLPIAETLYKHCHPARFTIRNLIRNKL